jgi:hypothetical protein
MMLWKIAKARTVTKSAISVLGPAVSLLLSL